MLTTVAFRYLGLSVQFIILSIIAHSVSAEDYGLYIISLSITFSCYYFVGLGTSESALFRISRSLALQEKDAVSETIGSVLIITLSCAALILAVAFSILYKYAENTSIIFALILIAATGIIFNVSQIFLSLGKSLVGSFLFYPAINITLLLSSVPTAIILEDPQFSQIALASSVGAGLSAISALIFCLWASRTYSLSWSLERAWQLIREGFGLTIVRVLHAGSFWIPTIVTGFMLSPTSAGLMGTAGRLAIAVSAIIAALRFIIRPTIAIALAQNNLAYLRTMSGSVAFISTTGAIFAIIINAVLGEYLIDLLFGSQLGAVSDILTILLISVFAEALFGPVDEILKVSGRQKTVFCIYGIGVSSFFVGCIIASSHGLIWIAWLQVIYVLGIFSAMNISVKRTLGFFILPRWPDFQTLWKLK